MNEKEVFKANLERWAILCPAEAEYLSTLECKHTFFTQTEKGEPNLVQNVEGKDVFYHSQVGAAEQAKKTLSEINLRNVSLIYVYGIGLGHIYDAAKEWLKDEHHNLIFLEDDLEVIHRFLETEHATEILNNKQVRLYHFRELDPSVDFWGTLSLMFGSREFKLISSGYYAERPTFGDLQATLSFWTNLNRTLSAEYATYGYRFFVNFYKNLHALPYVYRANGLYDQFKNVPAIICGAGPSLRKNLSVLETLGDRALIFAGGTAMNAVNSNGFLPHFGSGIDPNPAHLTRLIMNTAYEVPFFYRQRINAEALELVHAPRLYVNGTGGHQITEWLEKELGIPGVSINEGLNVVNFSMAIAHALGCNPIIFVGLDLAYSDGMSYFPQLESHPIHSKRRDFRTRTVEEDVIIKTDIFDNPVHTLWKWISESLWLAQFVSNTPDVLFINATEGGIGIPGVINKPLDEVKSYLLWRQMDLRARVHGEIQRNRMPETVTWERISSLLRDIDESLKKCQEFCVYLQFEYERLRNEAQAGKEVPEPLETPVLSENRDQLEKELAYKEILDEFDSYYKPLISLNFQKITYDIFISPKASLATRASLQRDRYKFLCDTGFVNQTLVRNFGFKAHKSLAEESKKTETQPQEHSPGEEYAFDGKNLTIRDPELQLDIHDVLPEDKKIIHDNVYYADEKLKLEQAFVDNCLHGPVTFYDEEGKIIARNWYVHGVQQGKSWYYYADGAIYSIERYIKGLMEGLQCYYYSNGCTKTLLNYRKGKLHGDVILYYPNGQKKRELHFVNGKREGTERMWGDSGVLILEVEYLDGRPFGTARMWYPSGQLSQEIVFDKEGIATSTEAWNVDGIKIHEKEADYFDAVTSKAHSLTKALKNICEGLAAMETLLTTASKEQQIVIHQQLGDLKTMMEQLGEFGHQLLEQSGIKEETDIEPVWKNPTSHRELQQQLEQVTKTLQQELIKINKIMINAQKQLEDKKDE